MAKKATATPKGQRKQGLKQRAKAADARPPRSKPASAKSHAKPTAAKRSNAKPQQAKATPPAAPPASSDAVRKSMQGNKRANTRPELLVRKRLREAGLVGYRLQWKVSGRPDVAWPGKRVCVFINGCFWHRHPGCSLTSMPKSNVEYWTFKFERNVERDAANMAALEEAGWKVHVIWECELRKDRIEETFAKLLPQLAEELDKTDALRRARA